MYQQACAPSKTYMGISPSCLFLASGGLLALWCSLACSYMTPASASVVTWHPSIVSLFSQGCLLIRTLVLLDYTLLQCNLLLTNYVFNMPISK